MTKLILMIFLLVNTAKAVDLNKHPIYKQIITNEPNINRTYAMKLSNIIHRKSLEYDIDSNLITAILMQESQYNLSAKRCRSGLREFTLFETIQYNIFCEQRFEEVSEFVKCLNDKPYMIESEVCTDFGIGQIHYSNLFPFSFNVEKLTTDLEYSVEAAFIILSDIKKRYFRDEYYWWSRYNASTPSKRKIYRKGVQRWM